MVQQFSKQSFETLGSCLDLPSHHPASAWQEGSVQTCKWSWRVAAGSRTALQILLKQQGRGEAFAAFKLCGYKTCFSFVPYSPVVQSTDRVTEWWGWKGPLGIT